MESAYPEEKGPITALETELPEIEIFSPKDFFKTYGAGTGERKRSLKAVVQPKNKNDIQDIVRFSKRHSIKLYPISTGRNWGYGSAMPFEDDCMILDLSGMNNIISFDDEMGILELEPGVTQGQLSTYLTQNNYEYMVPVTGAGPNCSILANALEKGFGITPYSDHAGSVQSLKAVLPDGSMYQSKMLDYAGSNISGVYSRDIGPDLDGLFFQSNFGIVVQAQIALKKKSKHTELMVFTIREGVAMNELMACLKELCGELYPQLGVVNIMNNERMQLTTRVERNVPLWLKPFVPKIAGWMGIAGIYVPKEIKKSFKKLLRKRLKPYTRSVKFFDSKKIDQMTSLFSGPLSKLFDPVEEHVRSIQTMFNVVNGIPDESTLALAYAKNWKAWDSGNKEKNPSRDGCGLLWYAPLIPLNPVLIQQFTEKIESYSKKNQLLSLTFTLASNSLAECTIPILFDRTDNEAVLAAKKTWENLFTMGKELGVVPYRLGIEHIDLINKLDCPGQTLTRRIKELLDPENLVAPGRYV